MTRVLLLTLVLAAGCAHVPAWEREHLARRVMQLEEDEDESVLEQHFFEAREGSAGGFGEAGGGCGCN